MSFSAKPTRSEGTGLSSLKRNFFSFLIMGVLAVQGTDTWAQHGDWCACGKAATIPISFQIEPQFTVWQTEAATAFARWNRYAQVFAPVTGDLIVAPNNGVNEIFFADAAFMLSTYGYVMNPSVYGRAFIYPSASFSGIPAFDACPKPFGTICGSFTEMDVVLNADFVLGWTNAPPNLDGSGPATYKATLLHEIGHTLGLHHNFDDLTTMNYYEDFAAEYLALSDTIAARNYYPGQAQSVSDVAIYPFRYDGGYKNAGTTVAAAFPTTVRQGDPILVSDFTLENVGSGTLSNVRYQLYLSADQTITTSDYLLGTLSFPSAAPGWWDSTGIIFTVPVSIPVNTYYLGALAFYNTSVADPVTYNNSWVLDSSRRVTITQNHSPNTPNNPSPSNGSSGRATNTVLSWTGGDPDGDPVTYDVYLEANDSTPDVLVCNDVNVTQCTPPASLLNSTLYYWKVVATDDRNASSTGPTWSFNTIAATSLTLVKQVVNNNGGTALASTWTLTASGPTSFSGPGPSVSNGAGFLAGTYNLSESVGAGGYSPSAWVCVGTGTQNDGDTVTLASGQSATCTITNDDVPPSLTLVKQVTNDDGGTAAPANWTLTASGPTGFNGPGPSISSGASFLAGTYNLSESGGPAGYSASAWGCVGTGTQNDGDTVTLALGQTSTCTITNDDTGPGLTLVKQVVNDNGGTALALAWTLTATGPTGFSGTGPSVSNGAGFQAGTYNLSESGGPVGYTASAWACVGGSQDDTDTIILDLGEFATCTISNDDVAPTLTLVKHLPNDDDGTATADQFQAYIDGNPVAWSTPIEVNVGQHVVSEDTLPGYVASGWFNACASNGTVTLAPGDAKTCEITNDDIGPDPLIFKDGFE